jgi:hypothetical protein
MPANPSRNMVWSSARSTLIGSAGKLQPFLVRYEPMVPILAYQGWPSNKRCTRPPERGFLHLPVRSVHTFMHLSSAVPSAGSPPWTDGVP